VKGSTRWSGNGYLSREGEGVVIGELRLEDADGVGIADGSLEETLQSDVNIEISRAHHQVLLLREIYLSVIDVPRGNNLEAGDGAIPGGIALRVLGGDGSRRTVAATEDDGALNETTRHVAALGGSVDNLIDGLHGEVPGHELNHGAGTGRQTNHQKQQKCVSKLRKVPSHGSTNTETSKTSLSNGRVNNALGTVLGEEALKKKISIRNIKRFEEEKAEESVIPWRPCKRRCRRRPPHP